MGWGADSWEGLGLLVLGFGLVCLFEICVGWPISVVVAVVMVVGVDAGWEVWRMRQGDELV